MLKYEYSKNEVIKEIKTVFINQISSEIKIFIY